jgi:hypothetical protein
MAADAGDPGWSTATAKEDDVMASVSLETQRRCANQDELHGEHAFIAKVALSLTEIEEGNHRTRVRRRSNMARGRTATTTTSTGD